MFAAGERILEFGPRFAIIKKGEHGSLLVTKDGAVAALPGYPARVVVDPTGAGDSFAGGIMGYLASINRFDTNAIRQAMVRGTVAASFTIEDFSLNRLKTLTRAELDARVAEYVRMLRLE